MIEWLKFQWRDKGTRILGYGGALVSIISLIDRETIDLIGNTFGPKYGPYITHGLTIIGALATAYRGHKNAHRDDP